MRAMVSTTQYPETIEHCLDEVGRRLAGDYRVSARTIGLLLLQNDPDMTAKVKERERAEFDRIMEVVEAAREAHGQPVNYVISVAQARAAERMAPAVSSLTAS